MTTFKAIDLRVNDWIDFGCGWVLVRHVEYSSVWAAGTLRAFGWPRPAGEGWARVTVVTVELDDVTVLFDEGDRVRRRLLAEAA